MKNTRIEHDFVGKLEIPNDCYYGIQSYRAAENFDITGIKLQKEPFIIKALAMIKKAAAQANRDCGVLEPVIANAIAHACDQVMTGEFDDQFVTDLIQGGAGTSVNMNANEVIANIALEFLGHKKGEYEIVHPNNHVNCSQSTNDVYPTALRLALYFKIQDFLGVMHQLKRAFEVKAEAFKEVLKMGRTQLQDAVPMALGDEFSAFGAVIAEDINRVKENQQLMLTVNMGGTAIGTKVNVPGDYPELCVEYLSKETELPITLAQNLIAATSDTGDFVQLMGTLKRVAVKLSKTCNDLRLLSSGPRTGLNEINLPAVQPGSSIMPGKVNPVIPEVVNQTCFYVIGQDVAVAMAAEAGQLQLNVMEPVIAFAMLTSIEYLGNAIKTLIDKCIVGITANEEVCAQSVMNSVGIVTMLSPALGYEICSDVAGEALETGKSVYDIVVQERRLITPEKWDEIYSFENMIRPKFVK